LRLHSRPPRQRLPSSLPYRKCLGPELAFVPEVSPPRHFRSRLTTSQDVLSSVPRVKPTGRGESSSCRSTSR
jgi:hypothetical protein